MRSAPTSWTRSKKEVERVSQHIVTQLRDLAKDRPTRIESVDINKVIRDSFLFFQQQLKLRQIQVNLAGLEEVSPVVADAGQLKQVFINLITNARDALEGRRDGVIRVTTRENEESVAVIFSDNGTGIALEHLSMIFEPFFTTKAQGMGMGLNIVKEIVERFSGRIQVEGEPGQGTTFTLTFPKKADGHDG